MCVTAHWDHWDRRHLAGPRSRGRRMPAVNLPPATRPTVLPSLEETDGARQRRTRTPVTVCRLEAGAPSGYGLRQSNPLEKTLVPFA